MPQASRKPNWDVWANVPALRVWEAIALSLDIDPKKVKGVSHAWMADSGHFLHDEGQQFEDRLEVLRRNLGKEHALPLVSIAMGDPDRCEIGLGNFARWAMQLGWNIPAELDLLGESASQTTRPPPEPVTDIKYKKAPALTIPDKLTLAWTWNHVPISWWWWFGTLLVATFAAGVTLGQSGLWAQLTGHVPTGVAPAASPPAEAKKEKPSADAPTAPSPPPKKAGEAAP